MYDLYSSKQAYVKGNPYNPRPASTPRTLRELDKNRPKPGQPIAPMNQPGMTQKPMPVKTYVQPQPTAAQQPQAAPQVAVDMPVHGQQTQTQTTQPPAFSGYNWSGVQGLSGQPASFRSNVEAMTLPQLQAYIAQRAPGHPSRMAIEGIMAQARARYATPTPAPTPTPNPTPTPTPTPNPNPSPTPQPPPNVPYVPPPMGVDVPLPDPGYLNTTPTQLLNDPFIKSWREIFPNSKNETYMGLMNLLGNREREQANLQDRDRGAAILSGQGYNPAAYNSRPDSPDYMQHVMQQAIQGMIQNPNQAPAQDPAREQLLSSLTNTLANPDPLSDNDFERMQTKIREDARRRREQNLGSLGQDFARRGLEGGAVDSFNLEAMLNSDASRDRELNDLFINRAMGRRDALTNAQGALGNFLDQDYTKKLQGMDTSQRLNLAGLGLGAQVQGQNFGQRAALADLFANTVRQPEDWSGLIGLQSVLGRPIPQPSSSTSSTDKWIQALGALGGVGTGLGNLISAF